MKLIPAASNMEALLKLYDDGLPPGASTGWPSIDAHYTVAASQFTVVTGIPGHGKSSWLDALLVQLMSRPLAGRPWRFLICSPENWPIETHEARLLSRIAGKRFGVGSNRMTKDQLRTAAVLLQERCVFVELGEEEIFPDLLTASMTFAATNKNHQIGIVLDPWNQLEHCRPSHLSETEYISYALSAAIRITRATGAHLWIVAHPAKLFRDKTTGERPVPTPYDIAGSAHFYNKPDNCICIWRKTGEEVYNDAVDVHIQKVRFQHVGKHGKATLRYDIPSGRYHDDASQRNYENKGTVHDFVLPREPGE